MPAWIYFVQPSTCGAAGPCFGEEEDLAVASNSVSDLASCRNQATQNLQKVQTHGVFVHVVFDILLPGFLF